MSDELYKILLGIAFQLMVIAILLLVLVTRSHASAPLGVAQDRRHLLPRAARLLPSPEAHRLAVFAAHWPRLQPLKGH